MTETLDRKRLAVWLLTAALSLPAGWLAARPSGRPAGDLLWAAVAFAPPWIVLRLLMRDFHWNAFFFGYLPPIAGFEALTAAGRADGRALAMVAALPLLAYATFWLTGALLFGAARLTRLAGELLNPDPDASPIPQRLGRWLRSGGISAGRWYACWLAGAAVGCALALAG